MKHSFTLFLLFAFSLGFSQTPKTKLENPFETHQNINKQFDYLYKKSTSYKEYKVIKMALYNQLKKSVLDSIKSQKQIIANKNVLISENNSQINSLQQQLSDTQTSLNTAIDVKDNRSVFGIPTSKSIFSTLITVTYIGLILLLGFFIFKFKQNFSTTKKAVADLKSLDEEFEEHKKNSLKRFQEVNRKLQDELNKNWKKEK